MPRKVTAYACKFKCGRGVTTKKVDMVRHENEMCSSNPENRACKTCAHNSHEYEYINENAMAKFYYCKIEKLSENQVAVMHCEHWQAKEGEGE